MGENLSYVFEIDEKADGLDDAISKLGTADKIMAKTSADTKGVEAALKDAGKSYDKLGSAAEAGGKKGAEAAHKHEEGFKGVGESISDARSKMHEFFEFVGAIAAFELLEKIADKVIEIGREALKAAADAEQLDLSFRLKLGQEGAEQVLGWVDKIYSKLPFTDDQIKKWDLDLLNAGVGVADLDTFIAAAGDVAAKSGDKMEGMSRAVEALKKAQLTGKVDTRELRGLSIGVDDLKQLPKYQHMNDAAIRKSLETGSLTKAELFKVIAGQDGVVGDLAKELSNTFGVKLKNLATLPEQYFQKLYEAPAFDLLKTKMDEIFDALDPNGPRGARIFDSLSRTFGHLVDLVGNIDFEAVALSIENDVLPAIESIAKEIKPILEDVRYLVEGLGLIAKYTIVKPVGAAVGAVSGARDEAALNKVDGAVDTSTAGGVFAHARNTLVGDILRFVPHVLGGGEGDASAALQRRADLAEKSASGAPALSGAAASTAAAQKLIGNTEVNFSAGSVILQVPEGADGKAAGEAAATSFVDGVRGKFRGAIEQVNLESGSS